MPAIDFKAALGNPTSIDHANIEIQGMRVSRTIKMALFTINENAVAQGDYILAKESYPIARVRFSVNRNVFRLQPGDVFKFVYPKYGITEMICRVVFIEEEDVESEKILITAIEESIHATAPVSIYTEPDNYRKQRPSGSVQVLTPIKIVELPYALFGEEEISLAFLVPRMTGNEAGYHIYMSQDGEEYYRIKTLSTFNPYGILAEAYPLTNEIDDEVGMTIDFDSAQNINLLQSISRTELMGTRNLALVDDELISFQTVIPITASQYKIEGVYRGRYGTEHVVHEIAAPFYYSNVIQPVRHYTFLAGSTRYFKIVPFSSSQVGSLAAASVWEFTFAGEAWRPYSPINLKLNNRAKNVKYGNGDDIVATWTPRVRGIGTDVGDPEVVIDSEVEHEGKFRVTVDFNGSTVRTAEEINVYTWTYTAAMNLADNGSYVSPLTFNVTNYVVDVNNIEYESFPVSLDIINLAYTTTTTTTSTTTTTTT